MRFVVLDEEVQILFDRLGRNGAEAFARLERRFEHGAAQMLEQDQQMVGVDQRLFRRTLEEIFRMMREELVDGIGRRDQHADRSFEPASGPTRLLSR